MKRRQFVAAGLALSALPAWAAPERFARGLLWRVSAPGTPPSHVFGTLHAADARLAELPAAVRKALLRRRWQCHKCRGGQQEPAPPHAAGLVIASGRTQRS